MMRTVIVAIIVIFDFVSASVIDSVAFVGNFRTKDKYLQKIVRPIVENEYDANTDSSIYYALKKTKLFSDIVVIASKKEQNDSVLIFVIVKEEKNLYITNVGLGINSMEYGEENDNWLWLSLGVYYNNFLGIGHSLDIVGKIWRDRYLGTNWHIPFGVSPYFIDVGGLAGRKPSLVFPWEISPYLDTHLRFGRYIGDKHKIYLETSPQYRKYNALKNYKRQIDETDEFTDEFWEIYEKLYYSYERSDQNYPPLSATFFKIGLSTNKIMAYDDGGEKKDFWNIDTDFRQNVPISEKNRHSLYFRSRISLTPFGEHNKYRGFLSGGQYYIRGYSDDILGSKDDFVFNNIILGTVEYQFLIKTLQAMKLGWLSWYDSSLSNFSPVLTGALFFDGGYLFEEMSHPLKVNTDAASVGFSIRIFQPLMKMGGAVELAWQVGGDKKYHYQNRRAPVVHIGFVSQF